MVKMSQCKECEEQFKSKELLRKHMVSHSKAGRFKCNECGKLFKRKFNLKNHMVVHSDERNYLCPVCDKRFKQSDTLKHHMLVHSEEKKHKCEKCNKCFRFRKNLKVHMRVHTVNNSAFTCRYCGKVFKQHSRLKNHIQVHTDPKYFNCDKCGKLFKTRKYLLRHRVVHSDKKEHSCDECGKLFKRKSDLRDHLLVHSDDKKFKCSTCGKTFRHKNSLEIHMPTHTLEKNFQCSKCGKLFARRTNLNSHMQVHTGLDNFKCGLCGETFRLQREFKAHILQHSADSKSTLDLKAPFMQNESRETTLLPEYCDEMNVIGDCDEEFIGDDPKVQLFLSEGETIFKSKDCSKPYPDVERLNSHILVHTSKNILICNECDEIFNDKESLKSHISTHKSKLSDEQVDCNKVFSGSETNENFQSLQLALHSSKISQTCGERDECFSSHGSLSPHKILHTGEKVMKGNQISHISEEKSEVKFECVECSQVFKDKEGLKVHSHLHESNKKHVCKICGDCFAEESCLELHLIIHTGQLSLICNDCDAMFTEKKSFKSHKLVCKNNFPGNGERGKKPTLKGRRKSHLPFESDRSACSEGGNSDAGDESSDVGHKNGRGGQCNFCGVLFSHLRDHVCLNEAETKRRCKKCNQIFNSNFSLASHMYTHSDEMFNDQSIGMVYNKTPETELFDTFTSNGEKSIVLNDDCEILEDCINDEMDLKLGKLDSIFTGQELCVPVPHTQDHTSEKIYVCNRCDERFTNKKSLKSHGIVHKYEKFKCTKCHKMFRRSDHLKIHLHRHSDEKKYICKVCGKHFKFRGSLKLHSHSHTGEKRFKCNECGKLCGTNAILTTHMIVHTGEKKFICEECGKQFAHKSSLSAHMVAHSGEKNYVCMECGKKFTQNGSLKEHVLIHRGEKNFVCQICGKQFINNKYLNRHLVCHSNKREHECKVCGKKFRRKWDARSHQSVHENAIVVRKKKSGSSKCSESLANQKYVDSNTQMPQHTDDKTFHHNEEDKLFMNKIDLDCHMLLQNPEEIVQRTECSKMFLDDTSVHVALTEHDIKKNLEYDEGVDVFTHHIMEHDSGELLKYHEEFSGNINAPIGVEQFVTEIYKCHKCYKLFADSNSLNAHMVVHGDDSIYIERIDYNDDVSNCSEIDIELNIRERF